MIFIRIQRGRKLFVCEPMKIPLHKMYEKPSFNGVYFEDRRHDDSIDNLDLKSL